MKLKTGSPKEILLGVLCLLLAAACLCPQVGMWMFNHIHMGLCK